MRHLFLLLAFVVSCSSSSVVLASVLDIGGTFLIHTGSSKQLKAFRAQMHKVLHNLVTPNVLSTGQVPESFHLYDFLYLLRSINKAALAVA